MKYCDVHKALKLNTIGNAIILISTIITLLIFTYAELHKNTAISLMLIKGMYLAFLSLGCVLKKYAMRNINQSLKALL